MPVGTVVSLFSGGGGFDCGFEQEGFDLRVAVEIDKHAIDTIRANHPKLPYIPRDIAQVDTREILRKAGLKEGEVTVVVGAPPCEPFSTAGRRNGFQDERANGVLQFIRVVTEAKPQFFAFEEVSAFTRAAKRHISFYERVSKRTEDLSPDVQLGSAFEEIMTKVEQTGYAITKGVLNAADFGAPQKRKRFIIIGARDGTRVPLPTATHAKREPQMAKQGVCKEWVTLREALQDLDDSDPEYMPFPWWGRYLEFVPPGGCWRDLPKAMHRKLLGGAFDDSDNALTKGKKGGRTGFMRRLSWEAPSPTLVDSPKTKAACLCHPSETRPLSIKEYARIQGFSDDWKFCGPISAKYRLIGQATPVPLARAIAKALLCAYRGPLCSTKGL